MDQKRLDDIELLRSLSHEERRQIGRRCRWRRYRAGEQIIDRDSAGQDVLFVVAGDVRILNYAANGRETAFAVVSAGGHVGEIAAIDGMARSASVVAVTACTIATLPARQFLDLVERHPAVASDLLRHLTRIIRTANERIAELSTVGAVQRVYRELLRISHGTSSGRVVVSPLPTQQDIASNVGATRETVARALGQLVGAGVIARQGRTLVIKDPDMLAVLADPEAESSTGFKA